MAFKTGAWGDQAKKRSQQRKAYFRKYSFKKRNPQSSYTGDSIGFRGELFAKEFLPKSKLIKKFYDIEWKGYKIDVKTSKPNIKHYQNKNGPATSQIWHFATKRQKGRIDYFFLLCMNTEEEIIKVYLVPDDQSPSSSINIGINHSKYDQFLI